jgi:hypothetical protein
MWQWNLELCWGIDGKKGRCLKKEDAPGDILVELTMNLWNTHSYHLQTSSLMSSVLFNSNSNSPQTVTKPFSPISSNQNQISKLPIKTEWKFMKSLDSYSISSLLQRSSRHLKTTLHPELTSLSATSSSKSNDFNRQLKLQTSAVVALFSIAINGEWFPTMPPPPNAKIFFCLDR